MRQPPGRSARVRLVLAVLAACLAPVTATAQTAVVVNPRTLTFTPSADHNVVLSDGRAAVDHYTFDVYSVGAGQPFQSTNIGKPAPAADGVVYHDFSAGVAGWPLPGGSYEARIVAVGPQGSGTSSPSNPFTFSTCTYALSGASASLPAAGGGTQVSVTTTSACSWSAASSVSWVVVSPSGATGSGTVVATVAANTSTAPRTAALTVAGMAFTITQAGASVAAPSTPSSPSPAAGAAGVGTTPTLTWTCAGAASYTVSFGTTNPPPQAASGLTTASYAPGGLVAGVTYYWRIAAVNGGGATTGPVWSFTTAAAPPPPPTPSLPAPWTGRDIGTISLAGSASASNGTFTVSGSGAGIRGTSDAFQYVSQPESGNFEIVARVASVQNTDTRARAGVMLRRRLTATSSHVTLAVRPNGTVELMKRSSTGGSTSYLTSTTQAVPCWLRLVRSGSTVTASVSADGATWRTVGSTTVGFTSGYVGLAVTSHNTALRNTSAFNNVTVR